MRYNRIHHSAVWQAHGNVSDAQSWLLWSVVGSKKEKNEKTLTSFICPLLRGKQGTCTDVHLKVEGWRFGWRWHWGGWIEEGDGEKKYWGNNDGGWLGKEV